jgi:arsenite methyltransferase
MLNKARTNASKSHINNVSFIESRITSVDLLNESADVVISNCVINLVPDEEKHLVFSEMHRILKPGGRVAISDILTKKPLPKDMKQNVALYVGCIAGASSKEEYETWLKEAGFEDVAIVDADNDLNVYTSGGINTECCSGIGEEKQPVKVKKQSCCVGQEEKDGGVAADMQKDLRNLNLNEWAGEYSWYGLHLYQLTCSRVVQDIRRQKVLISSTNHMISSNAIPCEEAVILRYKFHMQQCSRPKLFSEAI